MQTDPSASAGYTVKKGDTLSDIARRFNITLEQLLASNDQFKPGSADHRVADVNGEKARAKAGQKDRDADLIMPGETIKVPAGAKSPDGAKAAEADAGRSVAPPAADQAPKVAVPAPATPKSAAPAAQPAPPQVAQPPASASGAPASAPAPSRRQAGAEVKPPVKDANPVAKDNASPPQRVSGGLAQTEGTAKSRPGIVTDDARITAAGLQGSTSAPELKNVPRLAAMRHLADRGSAAGVGKPDGVVDAKEAAAFLADAKKVAVKAGSKDKDAVSLSGKEQQAVLSYVRANTNKAPTVQNAENLKVLDRALATYGEGSAAIKSDKIDEAHFTVASSLAVGVSTAVEKLQGVPGASLLPNGAVGALFASNQGSSLSVKGFTPNLDARDILMFPQKSSMPRQDYQEKRGEQGKHGDYTTGGRQWKAHGWAATKLDLSVGPATLGLNGQTVRTGAFTTTASVQYETIAEVFTPKGDGRLLITGNEGYNVQYSVTTEEGRLKDIMSGKVKAPNPRTLEGMKPGDVVMVWVGPSKSSEVEGRLLAGKGVARAGISVKHDEIQQSGRKVMIRMIENPDNKNEPHIQVYDGTKASEASINAFGLIANPKLSEGGAFARGLLQIRSENNREVYNFVEVNPADKAKGGGSELLGKILQSGRIPVDESGKAIPGALSHGIHDLTAQTEATTAQFSLYGEKNTKVAGYDKDMNWKKNEGNRGGAQIMAQYSPDLAIRIMATRNEIVRQSRPGSYLGVNGTQTVKQQISEFGRATLVKQTTIDPSSGAKSIEAGLTEKDLLSKSLGAAVDPSLFEKVVLNIPGGKTIEGQAAIDYLKTHEKPNKGTFAMFNPERANAVIKFDTWDKAQAFEARFKADQAAAQPKDKGVLYWNYQSQAMQAAALGAAFGQNSANDPNLAFNVSALQKALTTDQSFQEVTGYPMPSFIGAMRQYSKSTNNTKPYPATLEMTIDY